MVCETSRLPDGSTAIVCSGRTGRCKCGRRGTRQCDWKMPSKRSGACDAYLCADCATSPAPGKDLCAKHAAEWEVRKAERPEGARQ